MPLFKGIVESVTLPPELAYQSQLADRVPLLQAIKWEKVFTQGLAAGMVAFLIVMGKVLKDKFKKRGVDRDSDTISS